MGRILANHVLYGGFFLIGAVTVLLGPLIPEFKVRWGITDADVSFLFLAQFVTSSAGAIVATRHLGWSLVFGYAMVTAGLLGLTTESWSLAHLSFALIGLGLGLVAPATNILIAMRNPESRGAALATLNTIWGIGAVSCPLIFAALNNRLSSAFTLGLLAALGAVLCSVLALTSKALASTGLSSKDDEEKISDQPAGHREIILLSLLAGMLFLYAGIETSVGGWLVELSNQSASERSVVSLLIGSGFWGALLAGRASAAVLLRRISEKTLYKASLATAAVGVLGILFIDSQVGLAVGALAAGLGLASIYPLTVSILTAQTAATHSRGTGWVFAFAGFGAAALPWITGQVAGSSDALRDGFFVPLVGLVVLVLLYSVYQSRSAF